MRLLERIIVALLWVLLFCLLAGAFGLLLYDFGFSEPKVVALFLVCLGAAGLVALIIDRLE